MEKKISFYLLWVHMELEFQEYLLAIIEGYDKKDGVIWPAKVSPFHAIILNLDKKSQSVENFCNDMYLDFKEKGIDIFYDDRDERPGIKFSDSDLLGIPFVIIVGKNF